MLSPNNAFDMVTLLQVVWCHFKRHIKNCSFLFKCEMAQKKVEYDRLDMSCELV